MTYRTRVTAISVTLLLVAFAMSALFSLMTFDRTYRDEILGRCSKIYPELFPPPPSSQLKSHGSARKRSETRVAAKFNGDIMKTVRSVFFDV